MSFFKRHQPAEEPDTDEENDDSIDPELRLRTVRTAASAIAESIRSEQRMERRKTKHKRSRFFRSRNSRTEKKTEPPPATTSQPAPTSKVPGTRRNVYVNHPLSAMEVDHEGEPKVRYVRNKVRTASEYTIHNLQIFMTCHSFVLQNIPFTLLFPKTCTNNFDGELYISALETRDTTVLSLQYHSVANLFFLSLVILQCKQASAVDSQNC